MKQYKFVGSKLKNTSDPSQANPHSAGTVVEFVQPSKDNVYGRYYFTHYRRHFFMLEKALKYFEKIKELIDQCRNTTVGKDNVRHIDDKIKEELEVESTEYVVLTKIGLEYMTIEMLSFINSAICKKGGRIDMVQWETFTLLERIKSLLLALKLQLQIPTELTTLLSRRDLVEHPKWSHLYNCDLVEWKSVHLAWILSGDIYNYDESIVPFINAIIIAFEKFEKENQIPGELTGLTRGLKSMDQTKK